LGVQTFIRRIVQSFKSSFVIKEAHWKPKKKKKNHFEMHLQLINRTNNK
jgi:hypothetical protein